MSVETHVIVWFKDEYTRDGKKIVELVPCSWLKSDQNKTFCQYPPQSQRKMVRQWSKQAREPHFKWEKIEVEIITFACK